MLRTSTTIWIFFLIPLVLFFIGPEIGLGELAMNYKVVYYFFTALFALFAYSMFSLMMSFGILLRLMDRKHWHTAGFLGTIYWLLTKEARAVANDYYQFNPNKGVAK